MQDAVQSYQGSRALTTQDMTLIEQRVTNQAPSVGVAYLLWFFFGLLGGHRFYLGRPLSAVLQIVLNLVIVGFVWVLIDAFLIPGMIRSSQDRLREKFRSELLAGA